MIIALLFNWRAYPQELNYWHEIRRAVFAPGIIQKSGRHMKLSLGDVIVGLHRGQDPEALCIAAFGNSVWRLVDENQLIDGFPTIFGMVFENMPQTLACELDKALLAHTGYLGALSIHYEFGPHLALYRASLSLEYRLQGDTLRKFYAMGDTDGCDEFDLEEMKTFGYNDAAFEDRGANRTILDDYVTPRHFKRVAVFRELLTQAGREDDAYQLTMMLEDLSPKLFNALGAAAERLADAENEEEVAQVAISGRRYMEQLADALFPPINDMRGKRKLDKAAYRNRLWAFVEDNAGGDLQRLRELGSEIDRIVQELNVALHSDRKREQVAALISDAAVLTASLFTLNPNIVRNGYKAYMASLRDFTRELFIKSNVADI